MISNRKKEAAQIQVNQLSTSIRDMTKKIEFKRMDVHSIASQNAIITSKFPNKENLIKTLRQKIDRTKQRSSGLF